MQFYPFFLECSKRETNKEKKRILEILGFGKGGIIVNNKDEPFIIMDNGRFKIPKTYTDKSKNLLYNLLWSTDVDYNNMEHKIKNSAKLWVNIKKKDRFRLIDNYILQLPYCLKIKKIIKSIITIALILRLIQPTDIVYKDYNITQINSIDNLKYYFIKS